jgi:hypothetical protein
MRKTKLEILKETYEYYSDPNKRGHNGERCCYLTSDGKMCAVGRCLINPKKLQDLSGNTIISLVHNNNKINLNLRLKPEYRGHSLEFWCSLQVWHDNSSNFDTDNINERGELAYQRLVKRYS